MEPLAGVPRPELLRSAAVNLNHWYAVALSTELGHKPLAIQIWYQDIVLFRNPQNQVQALENRCPHRSVKLSSGYVQGNDIVCVYHGWSFDGTGHCTAIPYLNERQKLPPCRIRSYPVQERHGFIWLFPGDPAQAPHHQPLDLPEWAHLNYVVSVAPMDFQAHFSFLIENLMDMYHGHLHRNFQPWGQAVLHKKSRSLDWIEAEYHAECYFRIDRPWSVFQLFIPRLRRGFLTSLVVRYEYPHWHSWLGNDFRLYCLIIPVSTTQTRAYLIHTVSLGAFQDLHRLPIWFRRWVKNRCFNAAKGFLQGLIREDVLMMEQEQQAHLENPQARGLEVNPVVGSVQKLIDQQAQIHKTKD
ncbi:Rieske (2Fe-2S) domain-containing protein [Gloeomargarita lithophora Alchichica-D10]|uniref:Rieske (2Fe-2S) domain-containing protein n=1 Tax=Gloeomargarita lithophora Alchichica-D10 TaxID=1188229 RepID=A0A1J0AGD8_9CYAN|nr:aromatic ring-hydroxylating dioxygenase subunit alpha [Gloeomargarita lithophora]APB35009.1 Rieske (2Fe-2S) domain-containing protein [Gloeomargarita lithophora Alchichica-D10]